MSANYDFQAVDTGYSQSFRPQLFVVAAGSYATNAVYGAGAAPVQSGGSDVTYEAATYTDSSNSLRGTQGNFYRVGKNVQFDIVVSLDGTTDPATAAAVGTEVRLRTLPPSASEPGRYDIHLPNFDPKFPLPSFDVECVDLSTGAIVLPQAAADQVLKARLLPGGLLAFYILALAAPQTMTAVTRTMLSTYIFGAATPKQFRIRGQYVAA